MLSLFVYNREYEKAEKMSQRCRQYISSTGKDTERNEFYSDSKKLCDMSSEFSSTSMYILRNDSSIAGTAEHIQSVNDKNYIVLEFGKISEVMEAVSPSFRPSGLLLEDSDDEKLGHLIEEIYADYERCIRCEGETVHRFSIRGDEYTIPYSEIMYFESVSRKIKVVTEKNKYEYYDSIEKLTEKLPDCFMRVHRSLIVNSRYVEGVSYRTKEIYVAHSDPLPFSRGYSNVIKEYVKKTLKEKVF